MTTPITLDSNLSSDEVHNDEQMDLGTLGSPVLPTKASDRAAVSNNDLLHNKNGLSLKEPARTTLSGLLKVNFTPTTAKKQINICK